MKLRETAPESLTLPGPQGVHGKGLLVSIGLVALSGTAQVIVPTVGALAWKRTTTPGAIAGLLAEIDEQKEEFHRLYS